VSPVQSPEHATVWAGSSSSDRDDIAVRVASPVT